MNEAPDGKCGYAWPEDYEIGDDPNHQSCCYRDTVEDADRCAWHADPEETDEKTVEALKESRSDFEIRDQIDSDREFLDGAILVELKLKDSLSFRRVALRDAELRGADLRDAELWHTDLQGADLRDADFRDALLQNTYLQGAHLRDVDLRGAVLHLADLQGAYLQGADLRDANLQHATFEGVELNQSTQVGRRCPRLHSASAYDELAQSYHELKSEFSDQGLSQRARDVRFLEQVARRREAWDRGRYLMWAGSVLSHGLTRYGTRVWPVLFWTGLVLGLPTVWYALGPGPADGWEGGPLYYSVVTFVTAPPHPFGISGGWVIFLTRAIILIQTYLGTTLIILLGYVLGTRDRI